MFHRTQTTRHSVHRGLTLVELLVAATLASMLVVTAMALLKTLTMKRRLLMDEDAGAAWHQSLETQLRWDLANARRFELGSDCLRLVGYAARDFDTQLPTHRRSEVVYRLVRLGEQPWLMREETQPDMNSNHNRRCEIVCRGIDAITMEIPGQAKELQHAGSLPERFRLTLKRGTAAQPIIDIYYCR